MFNLNSVKFLENFVKSLNFKIYLLFVFFIQFSSILLSYRFLFDHEGCSKNINREFNLFGNQFDFIYPEMCDELFYFHGFQWINHIYEDGYVYQDRPLYLVIGFVIYRLFYVLSLIFNFQIDTVSLLLFTSFIIQILVINLISYFLSKFILGKVDKFYFLIFFLVAFFSFEYRIYLFLPANSTSYLLIFIYALYSIKNDKFNGLIYGLLFTISGYGVIGFLYEVLKKVLNFSSNFRVIIKNALLFLVPSIFFETVRLLLGRFQGPEYGIRYVHASEAYHQFTWFINSIFNSDYEPIHKCHKLSEFIPCYIELTFSFFSKTGFYMLFAIFMFTFYFFKSKKDVNPDFLIIFNFTIFNYLFISIQGLYQYRFVYYSLGFFTVVIICYFLSQFKNDFISLFSILLLTTYTLNRNNYQQFTLEISLVELTLMLVLLIVIILDLNVQKQNNFTN